MPEGDVLCPKYQRAADLLGRRWNALILKALLPGPRRFTEVTDVIPGLSDRLLSQRMKELEAAGIVTRRVFPDVPVRVEYALTTKGNDLESVLNELQRWADRWESEREAKSSLGVPMRSSAKRLLPGAV